ncbi:sugar MFS transporter [Microbulbifer agarilyticus]|uniref:sugar MFS transporter n=1 Tax=Microbulbifer agarilyticus TaxID=260552 RepID=UPI001C956CD5|nr:sugar MFS transporter [Microbulbifer agarilyticus]MBY6191866.1 sugar MFS transporter [Microbulbifer agarilyticus]MBY6212809.1 sugar MFS transporter [Microbulbifer agarilyticus]MCA0892482.1 sugar MFS transporter [Microbulbifer agarilyticus]
MAAIGPDIGQASISRVDEGASNQQFALIALTSLFFMWGFITCLNDILIPHLKGVFDLSYTQAMLVQFCFFGAYFLVSLPAGKLVERVGYQNGIVIGLGIAVIGCALFIPAARIQVYSLFLFALFVLAAGITVLQVSANPYVTALGAEETAASRLTLTQAFNSLGTTVAPFFGTALILSVAGVAASDISGVEGASAVELPYMILAASLAVLAFTFRFLKLPKIESHMGADQAAEKVGRWEALKHRHLALGVVAIFLYVGAEVSIGSFLVNFLSESNIAGITEHEAGFYVSLFWGGAMVGRFIGAAVMQYVSAGKVLAVCSVGAVILLLLTIFGSGQLAMWSVLSIGLCNSVMFPAIFSLALARLGPLTSQGSGFLCLAIVGGALVPLAQGALADSIGIQMAFALPIACYVYIMYYGLKGHFVREA